MWGSSLFRAFNFCPCFFFLLAFKNAVLYQLQDCSFSHSPIFWILASEFLLSVSDLKPGLVLISAFPRFCWNNIPPPLPVLSMHPSLNTHTLFLSPQITLCVVVHLFQGENQQIIFSVLNKLLYFDISTLCVGCSLFFPILFTIACFLWLLKWHHLASCFSIYPLL